MSSLKAFNCGASIVAYIKDGHHYGMTCAWAMMIDFDQIAMLLGGQAKTSNNLEVGMKVGVSSLASDQADVSSSFGRGHSDAIDKFALAPMEIKGNIALVKGAKVKMECTVTRIEEFAGEDKLVFLHVDSFEQDDSKEFLYGYDPAAY